MGIYWAAVDNNEKKYFSSPKGFSIKSPGILHYKNPFPAMVVMMNSRGYRFEIEDDMQTPCYYDKGYADITEEVYELLLQLWPDSRSFYGYKKED